MNKRLATWLLIIAGLSITVFSFYVVSLPLLASFISDQLRKQGILLHSLAVTDVSFNSLLLRNLSIGRDNELQISKIHITWRLHDLLAGTVGSIEISGLQAALDLSSEQPLWGSLQSVMPSAGEDTGAIWLHAISLRDSIIHLRSAQGHFVITLEGNVVQADSGIQTVHLDAEIKDSFVQGKSSLAIARDTQGHLQGKITVSEGKLNLPQLEIFNFSGQAAFVFSAMRPQHITAEFVLSDIHLPNSEQKEKVFEQARFNLQMDENNAHLTGTLMASDDSPVAHLDATVRHYDGTPDIELVLNTSNTANYYPWQLLGLAKPDSGMITLQMKVTGQTPPFQELYHNALHELNSLGWLQQLTLAGQARLELQNLSYAQKLSNLHGLLRLDAALTKGSGKLELHAETDRLVIGPIVARATSAVLPLQIRFEHDTLRMGLQKPGQVTIKKIDPMDAFNLKSSLDLSIQKMDMELVKNSRGAILNHHLVVWPRPITLLVKQKQAAAVEAQISPGKISLSGKLGSGEKYQGLGTIHHASLTLLPSQIRLNEITATLKFGTTENNRVADFTIGQLSHQIVTPYFAPFSLSGKITSKPVHGQPKVYTIDAVGGIPGTRYLRIIGEHALDGREGMLKIMIAPLTFATDGLQPKTLFPALAQLEDVSGMVSASVKFKWSKNGMRSNGILDLNNVSFIHQAAKISGLNATLDLVDLLSPRSPPRQSLTIRQVDAGIPMENLVVSYQIKDSPPRIVVEKANLFLLGGIVSLGPTLIDPTSVRNDILILVNNIELAALFDLIKVEGLAGNGRLDGSIPITFEGDHIIIQDSHLEADLPGTLQFQSEKAAQMLASTGKEMQLLLQVLQDFHYTELSLKLNKSATHDLKATLSLLGNNPNVKKGRMFRLNINLESNIGEILEAINQGYKLSNEILRDLFRLD
ncbi:MULTISPECIES: YdbH domain-containing protein [Nitrosomonas]|uniref:Dicarboxylate transport n=1 Tax=Nitrosomonas communis TaxID=44574 RepID=A0A5D3YDC4_9PROT|nr:MULTISPECIES: YdbH domain-containing protein [Nitrosomonas]TYP91020.1 dicarboxylate transport [Nitrosomonas communis]UVS61642.1 YdbH domain-containing protein [Nitrosomonas sp. PLL12]